MRHLSVDHRGRDRFAAPGSRLTPSRQPQPAPSIIRTTRTGCACRAAADVCSTPLATTALNPNGYGSTGQSTVAKDPPIDCFYVYPTVSRDQGLNSDLNAGREEKLAAEAQFARFASVCRHVRARSTGR